MGFLHFSKQGVRTSLILPTIVLTQIPKESWGFVCRTQGSFLFHSPQVLEGVSKQCLEPKIQQNLEKHKTLADKVCLCVFRCGRLDLRHPPFGILKTRDGHYRLSNRCLPKSTAVFQKPPSSFHDCWREGRKRIATSSHRVLSEFCQDNTEGGNNQLTAEQRPKSIDCWFC